jgi:PAS domain S-box-containing protein
MSNNSRLFTREVVRTLFEQIPDGIFIFDQQLHPIEVHSKGCEMLGYSPEDILGLSLTDLIPVDDLERDPGLLNELRAGKGEGHQHHLRCQDGRLLPVESSTRMLSSGWVLGIICKLTERENMAAPWQSEKQYQLIAEKTSDVIWLLDLTGKSLFVSPSIENFTGYTVDEYLKQTIKSRFTPESAGKAKELLERYVREFRYKPADLNDYRGTVELEYLCKNGETKWGELLVTPYCDEKGCLIAFHGATRDITERKNVEKSLKESEKKYRLLSENATDVIWTLDLAAGRFTYFSPSVQIMRGYTPEEALEIPLEKTLLPESYQKASVQIRESLGREAQHGMTPNRLRLMEFEEYCKDGSIIHTEAKVKFTRDKDGRPTGVIGISRDITERKQSEVERERLIVELKSALGYVKRLSGLLPICASCKKIRDDGGYWHDVAAYIHDHSEADFSHGICPDCMANLYPEYSQTDHIV